MTKLAKPLPKAAQDAFAALTPEQRRLLLRTGVRKRSAYVFLGMPLYDVAMGPDLAHGQMRGHAKGAVAIGDIATSVFALGGIARGVFALGGVAVGLCSFGGLSIGLVSAIGGAALSLGLAIGGGALGTVAIGGGAVGQYAVGGAPFGSFVAGPERVDREVIELFEGAGLELPAPAVRAPARGR